MDELDRTGLRVLAVDDEPELLEVYRDYLDEKFSVTTVTSGREALDLIDNDFDVILLDRKMSGLSGEDLLREIRARGIDTPVAMLTAVKPDIDIIDMPFDEYLEKPVEKSVLIDTIRILAKRSQFRQSSREFFRLASKRASLDDRYLDQPDREEYRRLLEQFGALQETLDETLQRLLTREAGVAVESEPDSEEVMDLLQGIHDHPLPDIVRDLVEDYQMLPDARPPFMWKWVHRLAPQNSLPCVPTEHREKVAIDKTLLILYITLLDDRLEKRRDRSTFEALASLPSGRDGDHPDVHEASVEFGRRLWSQISDRIERSPKYETYSDLFEFDLGRAFDAIEYSELIIRHPELATLGDLERYESHNMVMFAYADIDLMHTAQVDQSELPVLRDAIWIAQQMARIGNWVSTWERELREGDFSAGPIVYAVENRIVSIEELRLIERDTSVAEGLITRIRENDVEKHFLGKWERHYHELRSINDRIESFDLEEFVNGTEEILRYHLASRGLK